MTVGSESTETMRRYRSYIATAMNLPMLSQEWELELARRWREHADESALHELVGAYLRLVVSLAKRFRQYGLPLSDLVQEGNVGLMLAAARFEPCREVRFSTYASWWVRSAMQEFVLRNWSIVRTGTSSSQKALFFNLRWLRAKLDPVGASALNGTMRAKIAQDLKVSTREVSAMAERLAGHDQSLNDPIGSEGSDEWQNFLVDPAPTPEEIAISHRDGEIEHRWLISALDSLTERERLIIYARRLREDHVTLEELGAHLGITKERVRQIEKLAFRKLRDAVLRQAHKWSPLDQRCRTFRGRLAPMSLSQSEASENSVMQYS